MNISRPMKVVLFALTLWPVLYMVAFFMMFATRSFPTAEGFEVLFMVHAAAALTILGTMAFYIIDVVKRPSLSSEMRVVWALLIVFAGIVAMPIYFVMHVWPETTSSRLCP